MADKFCPPFVPMHEVLKPSHNGELHRLEKFEVTQEEVDRWGFRTPDLSVGTYMRLKRGRTVVMSDTVHERRTNYPAVRAAHGDVFIAGLGLGMVAVAMARKPEVTSIIIIEKEEDVIELVMAQLAGPLSELLDSVEVIQADIFDYKPARGTKYDTIYFDIWDDITTDNLPDMHKLHRSYGQRKAPNAWMSSWMFDKLTYRKEQEKKEWWYDR